VFTVYGLTSSDIGNSIPTTIKPGCDLPSLESQLQLGVPEFSPAIHLDPIWTSSAVYAGSSISPLLTYHSNANSIVAAPSVSIEPMASTTQNVMEDQEPAATDANADLPLSASPVHEKSGNSLGGSSGACRHSQTERYFCSYDNCVRSKKGSGFKRKDKLDQHLRGPHKQTSVPRARATPTAASSVSNPAAANTIVDGISKSKKRKRWNEEEVDGSNVDRLEKELAEERRLRELAGHRNQRLEEQLDDVKRRLDQYERLDKMLSLWEEHQQAKE